ncbi:MAG: potassium transporter [Alphaproteobacteria bacterium HGW-Alphaproteobacteria-16]|nr:MAG: potassium transporter [Alphaproteobacteria bacterium HGW-Alphaproteobacteria-16]
MHDELPFLKEAILFLVAAGLVMPLVRRVRISPVLGFLCIGLIVGPYGLGRLADVMPALDAVVLRDTEGVALLGELGVIFLLFAIGLELSVAQLWKMRRLVFGLGSAQVGVSAVAIGAVAWWYGNSTGASVVLGLCLALSSTAIVMQLLAEKLRLATPPGRAAFGVLLFQDLAVVPILFLVGVLGARSGQDDGPILLPAILALGGAVLMIAVILGAGRWVVRPVLRIAGGSGSREQFMAAVLLLILGTAALTAWAGLSMALGAFLAGLLFAGTEYRHQINNDIEPFKGLLLALFFLSVGMSLDPVAVYDRFWLIGAAAIGLIALKAAILFVLGRMFGLSPAVAGEAALTLGEGGEFAIVAITAALATGVIAPDAGQFILLVVVVTMFLTPGLAAAGRALGNRLAARQGMVDLPDSGDGAAHGDEEPRVVIGGFGRVGQLIARMLEDQRIPYVAIDMDPETVARHRDRGAAIYFGDASNPEVLARLGISDALAFAATMDQPGASERVVGAVHDAWPLVPIHARAVDPDHARRLVERGATSAVPETTEASLKLSETLLSELGIPEETARDIVDAHRAEITG